MGPMGGPDRTTSRSFTEISDDLRVARHELDAVINRIRAYQSEFMPPGLDFEAIAAAVAPECPLVYLITTSQGSLAFIVPPGTKTLEYQSRRLARGISQRRSGWLTRPAKRRG